jgi:hypothetical protein
MTRGISPDQKNPSKGITAKLSRLKALLETPKIAGVSDSERGNSLNSESP